jgi:hypothetical protein
MAKDNKGNVVDAGIDGKVKTGDQLFDDLLAHGKGQEIHVDRLIVDWDDLGDKKMPVVGFLVRTDELNLPPGAKRADNRTTWTAYLFQLTKPTRAILKNGSAKDIVDVEAGRQVYVAQNPKNVELNNFLGHEVMHEIAIMGTHTIETANSPMRTFRIAELGQTKRREGQFLKGGPVKSLPVPMPNGVSAAEIAAARNEVPFS